ncbi:hypothetical protein ACM7ZP_01910 [Pseudomonas aeruginosa]
MSMELFHGSYEEISEIRDSGIFGGLFGAHEKETALSHGETLHRIISPRPLTDYALNYEIESAWEVALDLAGGDENVAEAIMAKACESDSNDGWELQRLRGVLAVRLGYTSVEMEDEHGTTWLCLPGCTVEKI